MTCNHDRNVTLLTVGGRFFFIFVLTLLYTSYLACYLCSGALEKGIRKIDDFMKQDKIK